MIDPTPLLLAGGLVLGMSLGMGAAQIGGPISLNWRPRFGAIHHRLRCLPRGAPPARWRAAGVALVASLLAGGTLVAYAAEPSAPERMVRDVVGVTGSGDQLSLKVRAPDGERMLKIGETYEEGWTLQALTPTKATLAKDGAVREVGLDPTGALAAVAPAGAPSTVQVTGLLDEATIQHYVDNALSGEPKGLIRQDLQPLSPEESRRALAYDGMLRDELTRRTAADSSVKSLLLRASEMRALLGEGGYADYSALQQKARDGMWDQRTADLAARPVTGPTSYYVPAGANQAEVVRAQGIDQRGIWSAGSPDAQGGRTVTLLAGAAEAYAARRPAPSEPSLFGMYAFALLTPASFGAGSVEVIAAARRP